MLLTVIEPTIKFHLSLNVSDIGRSVAFYRVLFGLEPAKLHDDYAKFELDDPPVIFSLVPRMAGAGGSLSHMGWRVPEPERIEEFRVRLAEAGICTQDQNGTVCGYAKQDKLWVRDPDGTFWEIYFIEEEVSPVSIRQSVEGPAARVELPTAQVVWEHYVTEGTPERISHENDSVDEVRLTGTFNATLTGIETVRLVREVFRVLKPGGKVVTHGLMGDRPLPGDSPKLPGLAALVSRVPHHDEPAQVLTNAGFTGLQIVKYTDKAWFVHDGVEMREVKWVGYKPAPSPEDESRVVLYKGPFVRMKFEGQTFERGQRTTVSAEVSQRLRYGSAAEQFLFLEPGNSEACG